jgi:hypothetical protein
MQKPQSKLMSPQAMALLIVDTPPDLVVDSAHPDPSLWRRSEVLELLIWWIWRWTNTNTLLTSDQPKSGHTGPPAQHRKDAIGHRPATRDYDLRSKQTRSGSEKGERESDSGPRIDGL